MKALTIISLVIKHGPTLWKIGVEIWNKVKNDPNKKTPTAEELLKDVRESGTIDDLVKRLATPSKV